MRSNFWTICRAEQVEPLPMLDAVADAMLAQGMGYEAAVQAFTRAYVLRAGIVSGGNASRAARKIGVHRNTLGRLLEQLGLRSTRKPVHAERDAFAEASHAPDRAEERGRISRLAA